MRRAEQNTIFLIDQVYMVKNNFNDIFDNILKKIRSLYWRLSKWPHEPPNGMQYTILSKETLSAKGLQGYFSELKKITTLTRTNSSYISALDVTGLHERDCFSLTWQNESFSSGFQESKEG